MSESFWQKDSLITHTLLELKPMIIFSPVANFGDQSLVKAGPAELGVPRGTRGPIFAPPRYIPMSLLRNWPFYVYINSPSLRWF